MPRSDSGSAEETWFEDRWQGLRRLLIESDYRGHDPFDLLNSPLLRRLPMRGRIPLLVNKIGSRLAPDFLRRWLRVPPIEDPKIYACAYFGYRFHGTETDRAAAEAMIERLSGLAQPHGEAQAFWGYDYPWPTRCDGINPRGASTLVPGAFALLALFHHGWSQGRWSRESLIRQACSYYAEHHLRRAGGEPFLGYFANSKTNTHNVNLLGCAVLSMGGAIFAEKQWLEVAATAVVSTLNSIGEDGFLAYNDHPAGNWTDSFHHLYQIASLHAVAAFNPLVDRDRLQTAIAGLRAYYCRAFIREDGKINYYPGRLYPLDSHNYAAAALFALLLDEGKLMGKLDAGNLLRAGDDLTFWPQKGRYLHRRGRYFRDRRLFLRWNQAWMFAALGALYHAETLQGHIRLLAENPPVSPVFKGAG